MIVAFPVSLSIKTHHWLFSTKPSAENHHRFTSCDSTVSGSYSDIPWICLVACHGNRFPNAELNSARLFVRPEHRQQTQSSTQCGQEMYVNHIYVFICTSFYILKTEEKTGEKDGKRQLCKRVHILSTDRGLLYVWTEKLSPDGHMESTETPDSVSGCDLYSSRLVDDNKAPRASRLSTPHGVTFDSSKR